MSVGTNHSPPSLAGSTVKNVSDTDAGPYDE